MTRAMRWLLAVLVTGLLLGAGGLPAQPADKVTLRKVSYAELSRLVRAHTGKVVVVDVWSTTCPPCKKGFPNLVRMHRDLAREGLVAISVSLDPAGDPERVKNAEAFLRKMEATFTNVVLDLPEDEACKRFGIEGIPYVVVFDRGNRIAMKQPEKGKEEGVDYEKLRARVVQLLGAK